MDYINDATKVSQYERDDLVYQTQRLYEQQEKFETCLEKYTKQQPSKCKTTSKQNNAAHDFVPLEREQLTASAMDL